MTSTGASTVEGRVDYLLRESERTQRRLHDLEHMSEKRRNEIETELARLNRDLVAHVDRGIRTALGEYASARQLGLVCLGIASFSGRRPRLSVFSIALSIDSGIV